MSGSMIIMVVAFAMFTSIVVLAAMFVGGKSDKVDERIKELQEGTTHQTAEEMMNMRKSLQDQIAQMGKYVMPDDDDKERTALQSKLIQAGFYSQQALPIFMLCKVVMMIAPPMLGLLVGLLTGLSIVWTLVVCACLGVFFGLLGPTLFLDNRRKARQTAIRRGLPDAMDVLVICIEGGLSLDSAIARVATELQVAHPMLSMELNICQRQITLGQNTGEALQNFAKRADLEEIRSLAGVVQQAQKYGASMANALRIHAETMRMRRAQSAEEQAHKAATKMLFPTLLFIFPAIFVVILGPAIIQIAATFRNMKR